MLYHRVDSCTPACSDVLLWLECMSVIGCYTDSEIEIS